MKLLRLLSDIALFLCCFAAAAWETVILGRPADYGLDREDRE
jgi:hypothetical protein